MENAVTEHYISCGYEQQYQYSYFMLSKSSLHLYCRTNGHWALGVLFIESQKSNLSRLV